MTRKTNASEGALNSMEEKILTFECGNCGYPNIQIDVNIPYVGQRCPECKFVHMFKRQKEFECSTLILNTECDLK